MSWRPGHPTARRLFDWLESPEARLIPGDILVLHNGRVVTWRVRSRVIVWRVELDERLTLFLN